VAEIARLLFLMGWRRIYQEAGGAKLYSAPKRRLIQTKTFETISPSFAIHHGCVSLQVALISSKENNL
jgi:hypothetical protein